MKILTQQLDGIALDYAVTLIERPDALEYGVADWLEQRRSVVKNGEYLHRWHQSKNQGGEILERQFIATFHVEHSKASAGTKSEASEGCWAATHCYMAKSEVVDDVGRYGYSFAQSNLFYGPSPLVAGLRCYVESRLGESVEIPDEVCNA